MSRARPGISRWGWILALAFCSVLSAETAEVRRLEEELVSARGKRRAEILIDLGSRLMRTDTASVLRLGEEALDLAEDLRDPSLVVQSLNVLGRASDSMSRFEDAVAYYQSGIRIAEANQLSRELIPVLHRLGSVEALLGRTGEGLSLAHRALDLAESIDDEYGRCQALNQIGVIHMLRRDWENAKRFTLQALELTRPLGEPTELAGVLSNLGTISRSQGKHAESLAYLQEALSIQAELGEVKAQGSTRSRIGNTFEAMGDREAALREHLAALELRERANDGRGAMASLRDLRNLYRAQGEFERALEYSDQYERKREEVFGEESRQRIEELQTRFAVQQKERELALLRRTNQLQLLGFGGALSLAAVVAGLFFLRHRQQMRRVSVGLTRQRYRTALLEMESPGDWPRSVAVLEEELTRLFGTAVKCRFFCSEGRDSRDRFVEIGSDRPEPLPEGLQHRSLSVLTTGTPVFFNRGVVEGEPGSHALLPIGQCLLLLESRKPALFGEFRRRTAEELAEVAAAGLRRLVDLEALSIREMQLHQAQRMATVGAMTAGIAHHFNNLLQVVLGSLELALQEEAESRRYLDDATRAGRQAAQLIEQLAPFTRRVVRPEGQVLIELEELLREVAAQGFPGIRIDLDIRTPARVVGNPANLREVLKRLLDNAVDALAGVPDPSITLGLDLSPGPGKADSANKFACIAVADNGSGIDPDIRDRIFDPFFTTRRAEREGLGLTVVLHLVEQQGGWVEVTGVPAGGTRARVFLPSAGAGSPHPPVPAENSARG